MIAPGSVFSGRMPKISDSSKNVITRDFAGFASGVLSAGQDGERL